jgi:lipoprotein-anchoring transpeptidase ErfK/SrfK
MLRRSKRALCGAAVACLLFACPAYSAPTEDKNTSAASYSPLSPGEFIWSPEASTRGNVEIVVSLPLQVAYVYRGGTLIGVSTISSGKPGKETPTGSFEILQKRKEHYSNLHDNAPMPYMQRLTWDGIALHGGKIPGHPASHGCVRLPEKFAAQLFAVTKLGAAVHVVDAAASPDDAVAFLRERPSMQLASGG